MLYKYIFNKIYVNVSLMHGVLADNLHTKNSNALKFLNGVTWHYLTKINMKLDKTKNLNIRKNIMNWFLLFMK